MPRKNPEEYTTMEVKKTTRNRVMKKVKKTEVRNVSVYLDNLMDRDEEKQ